MARVALIPGGARGIGRAIGLALAERGWDVAFCYRKSEAEAAEAALAIQARKARALAIRADIGNSDEAAKLVTHTKQELGRIDALIYAAGPYHRVDLLDETPDGWRDTFDANLHGLFYCAQAVAPIMRAQKWGRVLAFSLANSDHVLAQPHLTAHAIAKTGVLMLVRTLARVLAGDGVTCNAISLGHIDSGSTSRKQLESMIPAIPAGRLGTLNDVGSVALFLLSDEAAYINGANIQLSGGWGL